MNFTFISTYKIICFLKRSKVIAVSANCFGVKYRPIFLRVVLYFDEPAGRVKIQTASKNIWRYFTPKHLMRDLLCNLIFSAYLSKLKENYKCNRMSARTVLYNNQLYNIVGYFTRFARFLYNNEYSWIIKIIITYNAKALYVIM